MGEITNLEIKISELEQIVSDLNDMVTKQWDTIDRHSSENRILKRRIANMEEALKSLNAAPPPHY